jgi:fructose-1,6-bisphosphatase I
MVSTVSLDITARHVANLFFSAGGQAIDSKMRRMMEVVPETIHDRAGIFMGSYDEVEKVKAFHK